MASQVVGRVVGLFTVGLEPGLMPKFCICGWNAAQTLPKCGQNAAKNFTLDVLSVGRYNGQVNELV